MLPRGRCRARGDRAPSKRRLRAAGTIGRLKGDQLVVVGSDVPDAGEAGMVVDRLRELSSRSFEVAGEPVELTSSAGIAVVSAPSGEGPRVRA
jgi:GGDEF domain-containing protein